MTLEDGRWSPGIGDPTVMGWLTVAAYMICAVCCFWAASRRMPVIHRREGIDTNPKRFWLLLGFLLITLGINKQLDLQSLLTQIGRDLAVQKGWYEQRRVLQLWFMLGLAGIGFGLLLVCVRWLSHTSGAVKLALVGCVVLFTFVLLRASSFHHMDRFLGLALGAAKMNWILELGSLGIIFLAGAITLFARDERP